MEYMLDVEVKGGKWCETEDKTPFLLVKATSPLYQIIYRIDSNINKIYFYFSEILLYGEVNSFLILTPSMTTLCTFIKNRTWLIRTTMKSKGKENK